MYCLAYGGHGCFDAYKPVPQPVYAYTVDLATLQALGIPTDPATLAALGIQVTPVAPTYAVQ